MGILRQILRREYGIPLLGVLVMTAPISWLIYTSVLLIINFISGFAAHFAFRSAAEFQDF
jgi:hypothetical protein